jgi:hypothetical protein
MNPQESELFDITRRLNEGYAKKWKHDIVFLEGNKEEEGSTTTTNYLSSLLHEALERKESYDHVLILDTDSYVYDFGKDITTLFSKDTKDKMVVARRLKGKDPAWKVASGVTLWNLHHPLTPRVKTSWSMGGMEDEALQTTLKAFNYAVVSTTTDFNSQDTAVVKYFQWRENTRQETHKERLRLDATEVCEKYRLTCDLEKETPEEDCEPRRDPTWEWRKYSNDDGKTTQAKKRLLVAQYSSYGKYGKLLELTSPVNKAYAKKWSHDFVIVQGSTLIVMEDRGCEPPPQRAMYDKLELLRMALRQKDKYDQLLLLDADAIICDLGFDITELAEQDDLLVAHRVSQKNSDPHTWNVNNGVVLWNLEHPETTQVADEWEKQTQKAVSGGGEAHGDQHYLQSVLKLQNRHEHVKGLASEFFYGNGTIVKHFIRTNATNEWNNNNNRLDAREVAIGDAVTKICQEFPSDCEALETSTYAR